MRTTNRQRGFTLIELLVVIAIIAILAAILFPVFTSARKSALKARCVANEKQILAALAMYAQDNGGRAPLGYDVDRDDYNYRSATFGTTWVERVVKYTKNWQVFVCPSVPEVVLNYKFGNVEFYVPSNGRRTTYALNWRLCSGGGGIDNTNLMVITANASALRSAGLFGKTMVLEAVRRPSKTVAICESQHQAVRILKAGKREPSIAAGGGSLVFGDTNFYYWQIRWLSNPYLPQGHGWGANFGMIDGHVQFVKSIKPDMTGATGPGIPPRYDSTLEAAELTWWD